MRHHTENVHFSVGHTSNIGNRTVGIGPCVDSACFIAVLKQDLVVIVKRFESVVIDEVIAFPVGDADLANGACLKRPEPQRQGPRSEISAQNSRDAHPRVA